MNITELDKMTPTTIVSLAAILQKVMEDSTTRMKTRKAAENLFQQVCAHLGNIPPPATEETRLLSDIIGRLNESLK